jgi:AcrR family transcriptional regulator
MAAKLEDQGQHRRRGQQLESALLNVTWDVLVEVGFANLTMELIAARAHTGIAVLYRRWANKDKLVLAAFEHYRRTHEAEIPDTGTLRNDLLLGLAHLSEARSTFFAIVSATVFAGLKTEIGLTPAQVRDHFMGGHPSPLFQVIYRRAHNRGEIDLSRIPASVLAMPFDLVRHDMFMELKLVESARIESIVDELFLPLVRHYLTP